LRQVRGTGSFLTQNQAELPVEEIIFLHYWGTGPAEKLARGFNAAVNELGKHRGTGAR
jgi:hypothetical protein